MRHLALAFALALGLPVAAQAATCPAGGYNFTLDTSANATCGASADLGTGALDLLGYTGWQLGDSSDSGATQTDEVLFSDMPGVGQTGGPWSLVGYNGFDPVMIVLQAAGYYGAFLIFSADNANGGIWFITRDVCNPGCAEESAPLAQVSLYHQPAAVPLPAAGWALLAALGGLALAARRRRAA